jgi:hypothetical protein
MMKARLSTQLGSVKEFMGQSHLTHTCNSLNEISETIIKEKVMAASGSGSNVIDEKTGQAIARAQSTTSATLKGREVHHTEGEAMFSDECVAALADVRNDNTPTTWAAFTYANSNSPNLVKLATGSGGTEEVESHLKDDVVVYALIRKIEKIDETQAVKFCYIRWLGDNIPRMQRAKLGASASAIQQHFSPFHVSLDSPDRNEVTDANIMKLIMIASGTYQHTLEDGTRPLVKKAVEPTPQQSSPVVAQNAPKTVTTVKPVSLSQGGHDNTKVGTTGTRGMGGEKLAQSNTRADGVINFQDEESILNAIKAVRNDSDNTDWCLVTYTAPKSNTLKFHASGSGGLEELRSNLKNDVVMYGLYRDYDQIDDTTAVKFCFVDWRGENINRMQRANLGIHSGEVTTLFRPYHVDVQCSDATEITRNIILDKIKFASGTAVHVK